MYNELSRIQLAGTNFFINGRIEELRKEGPPFNSIRFSEMELSGDGETMLFLYNKATKDIFHFTAQLKSIPDTVVVMQIPHEGALDPVGYARRRSHEVSIETMLEIFPIKPQQYAKEIPLSDTHIPKILAARNMIRRQTNSDQVRPKRK